jgi:DNA-binding CsgD family transcriptional regulator
VLRNLAVLGFLELSRGEPEAALCYLEDADARARGTGHLDPNPIGRFHGDLIEALISLGRLDDAEFRLSELDAQARALGRRSLLALCERCRSLLYAQRGDPMAGLAAAERSLTLYELLQLPFERGRALLVLGQIARRAHKKRAAREAFDRARAAFGALAAWPWVEKADAEAARIGGRTRAQGLTATEQRLAALVREGRSNKEIAASLFVTPRTVEKSLSRIYAKLGVHTRGQLVSRLAAADQPALEATPGKVS